MNDQNVHAENSKLVFNSGGEMIDAIFPAPIYPATPQGRPLRRITPGLEIHSREQLRSWWQRGVKRYIFRPIDAGMIGVDCDIKNGKDGVRELQRIDSWILQQINGGR